MTVRTDATTTTTSAAAGSQSDDHKREKVKETEVPTNMMRNKKQSKRAHPHRSAAIVHSFITQGARLGDGNNIAELI